MDNVVYFNTSKNIENQKYDFLCVYMGGKSCNDSSRFYSALEVSLKSCGSLPDGIVIYCNNDKIEECNNYWSDSDLRDNFYNRLSINNIRYTKSIFFIEICTNGFNIMGCDNNSNNSKILSVEDIKRFFKDGIKHLIDINDVIHVAPAGHTFKHPSGRTTKLFIQSRDIARTETELQFIGRGLNVLVEEINWSKIETVYIDTMGVYPIVKEAVSIARCSANIESFHSYSYFERLNPPDGEYLIIISASTSGNMAKALTERGFNKDKIITLIDLTQRDDYCKVLIDLSSTRLLKDLSKIDGSETDIELVGEHFSYKAKPAKAITIGVPHRPTCLLDILKDFGVSGINEINKRIEAIGKNPLLSLKPEGLYGSKKFLKWLQDELSWSLSSKINTVVYSDDGASEQLAELTYDFIKNSKDKSTKTSIVKWQDISKKSLEESTGIIVVSAFSGDGGTLRQISRDLREYEESTIPRHFLIGVGLPQSMESWARLEQFLVRNATSRSYNFSTWKVLPLGPDNVKNSWSELMQLASTAENMSECPLEFLSYDDASLYFDAMTEVISNSKNSLLPNTKSEQLKITEGFVFFNGIFDSRIDELSQCETLMAITSALQTAREHKDDDKCLRPTSYQSVVISPENFLRFNDPILQASILRASLPSELDYSSDQHLSELMKEFLFKVFSRNMHPFGHAALEFGAALAIGKLKLKNEHCRDLIENILKDSNISDLALKGFLLMAFINQSL
ncbi:hypothetical protein MJ923_16540 [Shewanella sp. 3B26]|uniref:Uncharacterized protein n=1 Tax=Shewanella zhuhaiensis TaxID=2919576 RepID=A0AAJ1BJD0_9GAMM|nr:hypothetical protein [Shewanella zhuhaiensis]MCH4295916.1 hypothetical protein [Shewanella zhuhaiensis]